MWAGVLGERSRLASAYTGIISAQVVLEAMRLDELSERMSTEQGRGPRTWWVTTLLLAGCRQPHGGVLLTLGGVRK